jgi:hypothetical protein
MTTRGEEKGAKGYGPGEVGWAAGGLVGMGCCGQRKEGEGREKRERGWAKREGEAQGFRV